MDVAEVQVGGDHGEHEEGKRPRPVSHSSAKPISSVQIASNTSNGSWPSTAKNSAAGGEYVNASWVATGREYGSARSTAQYACASPAGTGRRT